MEESEEIRQQQALILFEQAHKHQLKGEFADAILLYKRAIAIYPTAEAYTYLGWTYSMMQRYDEAIEQCELAIDLDPSYGNPYNDIGAYLIELDRWEEAIIWLERALLAPRYEQPQFAYLNLGRVYERLGDVDRALAHYDQALALDPFYRTAHMAKYRLLGRLN
jgi:tetratricopeptide (TPR) repeat protein